MIFFPKGYHQNIFHRKFSILPNLSQKKKIICFSCGAHFGALKSCRIRVCSLLIVAVLWIKEAVSGMSGPFFFSYLYTSQKMHTVCKLTCSHVIARGAYLIVSVFLASKYRAGIPAKLNITSKVHFYSTWTVFLWFKSSIRYMKKKHPFPFSFLQNKETLFASSSCIIDFSRFIFPPPTPLLVSPTLYPLALTMLSELAMPFELFWPSTSFNNGALWMVCPRSFCTTPPWGRSSKAIQSPSQHIAT